MPIVTYCHFIIYILLYYHCIWQFTGSITHSHMEDGGLPLNVTWILNGSSSSSNNIYIRWILHSNTSKTDWWCGIVSSTNIRMSKDIQQSVFSTIQHLLFYHLSAEPTIHHVPPHSILYRSVVKIVVYLDSISWSSYVTLKSRWSRMHKVYTYTSSIPM